MDSSSPSPDQMDGQVQAVQKSHEERTPQPQEAVPRPVPPPRYTSRIEIRRAICAILRRILIQRLASRGHRPILTKAWREQTWCQSRVLESIFYRRASSMEAYGDIETLEPRIYTAERLIRMQQQREFMEQESKRRIAAAATEEVARLIVRRSRGFR